MRGILWGLLLAILGGLWFHASSQIPTLTVSVSPAIQQIILYGPWAVMVLGLVVILEAILSKPVQAPVPQPEEAATQQRAQSETPPAIAAQSREPQSEQKRQAHLVYFLRRLQEKGRFVDFLMGDMSKYSDQQVSAAARVVHQGCGEVVREYFTISELNQEREGSSVSLEKDYPSHEYKLLGDIGEPPFEGKLVHRGWQTAEVKLPELQLSEEAADPARASKIIVPAQVKLQ